PSAEKCLRELLELFLHSNDIQSIAPDVFHHLHKLRSLTLSRNKLEILPPGLFLHLRDLSKLTLYGNPLKSLPEVLFGEMRNLGSLWLYHTKLSTIPDFVFSNLTNLDGLKELRGLSLLQNLQNVSLFSSRLQVLPRSLFRNLKHLQKVYLNSTKLQSLPEDLFTTLPELQEVYLDDNPWKCDCQILGFREWLQKSTESLHVAMALGVQNTDGKLKENPHPPPHTALPFSQCAAAFLHWTAALPCSTTALDAAPPCDWLVRQSSPWARKKCKQHGEVYTGAQL
uniref:LRRCT domain-containing protein n=1 Tax=Phasianus colchicus TaxID=9054 RepID=A0A669Q6B1_PHACC